MAATRYRSSAWTRVAAGPGVIAASQLDCAQAIAATGNCGPSRDVRSALRDQMPATPAVKQIKAMLVASDGIRHLSRN